MTSILKTRIKSSLPRDEKKQSPKLIVISSEGPVTEEMYFQDILADLCAEISSRIRIVSAREEFFQSDPSQRDQQKIDAQNRSQPRDIMTRMDDYLKDEKYIAGSKTVDDEYWLVLDVDHHTDENHIDAWNAVLAQASSKGYRLAVSNPFFEAWLLLHHREANDEDEKLGVTSTQPYKKTNYFQKQLKACGAPLTGKNKKEPCLSHYDLDKVKKAIVRAKALWDDSETGKTGEPSDASDTRWPQSFGSTVYILVRDIIKLMEQEAS